MFAKNYMFINILSFISRYSCFDIRNIININKYII